MKSIFLTGLALCLLLVFLTGCSNRQSEYIQTQNNTIQSLSRLNEYTPILLFENMVFFNYFEGTTLTIGRYCISEEEKVVLTLIYNFHMSFMSPVLTLESFYLPVTLSNGEHKLIQVNLATDNIEQINIGRHSRLLTSVISVSENIFTLSRNFVDGITYSHIKLLNREENKMDSFAIKKFDEEQGIGEMVEAISSSNDILYAIVRVGIEEYERIIIRAYCIESGDVLYELGFSDDLLPYVLSSAIAQFYMLGNHIYVRNFLDYGLIGEINGGLIDLVYARPLLRIARNGFSSRDEYSIFFIRGSTNFYMLNILDGMIFEGNLPLKHNESIRSANFDGENLLVVALNENITDRFATSDTILFSYNHLAEIAN